MYFFLSFPYVPIYFLNGSFECMHLEYMISSLYFRSSFNQVGAVRSGWVSLMWKGPVTVIIA